MNTVISLQNVEKAYTIYPSPKSRFVEMITGKNQHSVYQALHTLNLDLKRGEVVGIVGMNGAGKSTLLKLIAGTLHPSNGTITVKGKVASLLELGTGFHMDLTGRENVLMGCAIQGLSEKESLARFDEIVDFAELSRVIDQPVKTYSSGMMMRLAFSVATSVDPDILIIDEALSVGDARFAQKSFERIMQFCDQGITILFCSHSLYQIETICSRAIWLDQGRLIMDHEAKEVVTRYSEYIDDLNAKLHTDQEISTEQKAVEASSACKENLDQNNSIENADQKIASDTYKMQKIILLVDDQEVQKNAKLVANESSFKVKVVFSGPPSAPSPNLAVCFTGEDGRIIASTGNWNDGAELVCDADGCGEVTVEFPKFGLLKGRYYVFIYLMDERGLFPYDQAENIMSLDVTQNDTEQGRVKIPRKWYV